MPKTHLTFNDFSGGLQTVRDPRDLNRNELASAINVSFEKRGAIKTLGGIATHSTINNATATSVGGYGLALLESDYETEPISYTGSSSLYIDAAGWIAVIIDIASITQGSGYTRIVTTNAHGLTAGYDIEIIGTAGNDDVTVVGTVVNSTTIDIPSTGGGNEGSVGNVWLLFNSLVSVGEEIIVFGTSLNNGLFLVSRVSSNGRYIYSTTDRLDEVSSGTIKIIHKNEILVLLSDADNGQLDTYSKNNDLWTVNQASVDTTSGNLANSVKLQSYAIDGVIRLCDAEFGNANKVKWFGLINNIHFPGCTAEDIYFDWYAKDNTLAKPTDGEIGNTYPTANTGFDFEIDTPVDANSEWDAATYEIAHSFIYDGNQESLLYIPTANNTFTVAAGDSVTVSVHAKTDSTGYDSRITGGRLYCRISGSDDDWVLLCDIGMRVGARASLDGTYAAWVNGTTPATDIDTGTVTSLAMSADTYESLNGYSHQVESNSLGLAGENWKTAVIAGRRVFVANVRRYDQTTGANKTYADRIYYSSVNKFDTFPTNQYLDVVKGDAESYVCLKVYADRLLAFKQNSCQFINIASGSDIDWYLEENKKYHGIYHWAAACDTEFGTAWINKSGCFLYDGSNTINLITEKIDATEWASFIGAAANDISIIGYDRNRKQLIVLRDCTGNQADGGDVYIFDFYTKSWTTGTDIFTDTRVYSNFVHDWNGNLILGEENSGTITFKSWSDTSISHSATIETKDEDFGDLIHIKKIYNVYISVKEQGGADEVITVKYRYDGNNSTWLTTGFDSTETISANDEGVLVFAFSAPIEVQSLQLQVTYSGIVLINDVTVEYRTISKRVS